MGKLPRDQSSVQRISRRGQNRKPQISRSRKQNNGGKRRGAISGSDVRIGPTWIDS